ncbi:protein NUCLEAR FUSION DEFECTIVE 6, chloroplastic/mitochondrial-like isoform X2 [Durio zibethinus]|uniref:Protein NUCLEAR FUSION DEFECTIVE 6, chloroplastic/mitochondrial-like isoform X2 n=1 Tax=Durio zibethinus TaxID=66656 RepID=A0A6P6AH00_DURZI|nr:protein NUCLEAR FUSION DEFECTIVE 6, chloroplastic/mitochondrial-like isoform X2 [Durio zibethinus]XP_022764082.1 protein NUCLEAR FUSION DEFECTIVE 6, chloroplastic/mitochondrial-like isoform X2 [Durio zibethinus]
MASSAAAARSVIRSSSARNAVSQLYSQAKAAPSPFHVSSKFRLSGRIFRCPVKASVCVESVLPYHTATASALMKSMLSISRRSYVWLPEGWRGKTPWS